MNIQRINFILTILNLLAGCVGLGFGLSFHIIGLIILGGGTIAFMLILLLVWK